jgi:putative phosphoribosyl transferase
MVSPFSRHTADRSVEISASDATLRGDLFLPDAPTGLVLFIHGPGSNRHSPRSRKLSTILTDLGLATMLFDLLTPLEEAENQWRGHLGFDIPFLAARLLAAMDWAAESPLSRDLGIGLFGASSGAAAGLLAAAERPLEVQAVVARSGRPDLVTEHLRHVVAPSLFIVGEKDEPVLGWNREASTHLSGDHTLHVIPGATHLFPEPGALEEVSRVTSEWFAKYLQRSHPPSIHSPD